MSRKSRAAARKLLEQYQRERLRKNPDILQLEDAKGAYWWQRYDEAGRLLFSLSRRIIIEPLKGTEEYKDGERKPDTPVPEQPEEEEPVEDIYAQFDVLAEGDSGNAATAERDEDGYLIR